MLVSIPPTHRLPSGQKRQGPTPVEADPRISIAPPAVTTPPALLAARTELVHVRTNDIDSKPSTARE
jgi:hypothetical protein